MSSKKFPEDYKRVVFYDGDCGFCNKAVEIILKFKKVNFYFVALQSPLAKDFFHERGIICNMDTMYYLENNELFMRSRAAVKIGTNLRFPYTVFSKILGILPVKLGDFFYNIVARNRKKIFRNKCYLPNQNERSFFIET